jgi:spoIIIJ-associated protein
MGESQQQRGQQWLETFLKLANLPAAVQVQMRESGSESSCWLTIDATALTPEQIAALTGDHGSALDSIQYLANTILNLGAVPEDQGSFTIELNGYRQQRLEILAKIAQAAAQSVRETGEEYEVKSLSSAERRQIHTILQSEADLETFSRGQEPNRHLVVRPVQSQS